MLARPHEDTDPHNPHNEPRPERSCPTPTCAAGPVHPTPSHALLRSSSAASGPAAPSVPAICARTYQRRSALPGDQGVHNRPVAGSSSPHHCAYREAASPARAGSRSAGCPSTASRAVTSSSGPHTSRRRPCSTRSRRVVPSPAETASAGAPRVRGPARRTRTSRPASSATWTRPASGGRARPEPAGSASASVWTVLGDHRARKCR